MRQPIRHNRLAILICARNESAVLPHLLKSIQEQDYPQEMMQVFVLADNCDDDTARVAQACGAVVYQRQDREHTGKGYALDYLLEAVWRDHGAFDAYLNFDADNLLQRDFISKMNEGFCQGADALTSYRNSKNFGDSWVSAGSGAGYLREAEYQNHARDLLGVSAAISGTGWLVSHEAIAALGGYKFFRLTDDFEFTHALITSGRRIGYCKDAVLYDEQPVTFRQLYTQRLRWCKGYLQVFGAYFSKLVQGMLRGQTWQRRFACYDMLMLNIPLGALIFLWLMTAVAEAAAGGTWLPLVRLLGASYGLPLAVGALAVISQWGRIKASKAAKVRGMLAFPVLTMLWTPIYAIACLKKNVSYVPTPHSAAVDIHQVEGKHHRERGACL